ncbi:MAG: hypothetical protein Q7U04_10635 [Bacteriovorax sp.]|nr:hypothetical protein [Bacteriovorax sp.]
MKNEFVVSDLRLYFNSEVNFLVILDQIDNEYFTIITSQDPQYEYGFKIHIKNLNSKYFLKVDKQFARLPGTWERFNNRDLFVIAQQLKFEL